MRPSYPGIPSLNALSLEEGHGAVDKDQLLSLPVSQLSYL